MLAVKNECLLDLVLLELGAQLENVIHNTLDRLENWTWPFWHKAKLIESSTGGYTLSGVPQGSVLCPLVFSIWVLPLMQIIENEKEAVQSCYPHVFRVIRSQVDSCGAVNTQTMHRGCVLRSDRCDVNRVWALNLLKMSADIHEGFLLQRTIELVTPVSPLTTLRVKPLRRNFISGYNDVNKRIKLTKE